MPSLRWPLALAAVLVLPPAALAVHGCAGEVSVPLADAGPSMCDGGDCPSEDAGPLPCGTMTCGPNQICVDPCCGGAPGGCMAVPDGGCPPDYELVSECEDSETGNLYFPGCQETSCTPDPPTCVDIPAACGGEPTCDCLPLDACTGGGCEIYGRNVACLCE